MILVVGATVGSSLAMTGADVMTRGAEETGAGAGLTTRGAEEAGLEGPGTAGTGLKPEGIRRLLAEFGARLKFDKISLD